MTEYFDYEDIENGSLEDVTLYRSPYSDGVSNNSHSGLGRGSVIEEVDPPPLMKSTEYPDDTVMSNIDRSKTSSILPSDWAIRRSGNEILKNTQISRVKNPQSINRRKMYECFELGDYSLIIYIILAIIGIIAIYFCYNKFIGGNGFRRSFRSFRRY
jgi:hypothetical protein